MPQPLNGPLKFRRVVCRAVLEPEQFLDFPPQSESLFGGKPPFPIFIVLLAACFFLFGLTVPNFNAMSMEPLGAIAGTASSFIGFYTTLFGAIMGMVVGQSVAGSVLPLALGYFCLGFLAIISTFWAEKGKLFGGQMGAQPH